MKLSTITVLPLLASAAVVPLDLRTTVPETISIPTYSIQPQQLEKRQFWNYVGNVLQNTLPGLLRWVADNVTSMLKWQESPLKKFNLVPAMNQKAKRAVFRY